MLGEPTARLLYTPTASQTVWAAYTHAVRTPSDAERDFNLSSFLGYARNGLPFFARFSANPKFRSEQLNGYELGYRGLEGRNLFLDIAGFYNHYGDLFSEDVLGPAYVEANPASTHLLLPAQFGNGLVASTTGMEVAPSGAHAPGGASVVVLLSRYAREEGYRLIGLRHRAIVQGSSPQHQALLRSGFDLPKSVNLDIQARYVNALPGIKVPSYWTGNATAQWAATRHIRLTAVGRNLLQPHHLEFVYDPGPAVGIRRAFYGEITFTR